MVDITYSAWATNDIFDKLRWELERFAYISCELLLNPETYALKHTEEECRAPFLLGAAGNLQRSYYLRAIVFNSPLLPHLFAKTSRFSQNSVVGTANF